MTRSPPRDLDQGPDEIVPAVEMAASMLEGALDAADLPHEDALRVLAMVVAGRVSPFIVGGGDHARWSYEFFWMALREELTGIEGRMADHAFDLHGPGGERVTETVRIRDREFRLGASYAMPGGVRWTLDGFSSAEEWGAPGGCSVRFPGGRVLAHKPGFARGGIVASGHHFAGSAGEEVPDAD